MGKHYRSSTDFRSDHNAGISHKAMLANPNTTEMGLAKKADRSVDFAMH
jgi:hypothetical protein